MDTFTEAYIECALWSSDDMDADLAPETQRIMEEDCADFQAANAEDLEEYAQHRDLAHAGHDFWLTRNGHGAGFWDRGLGELGERLTKASDVYGRVDLYLGDDGQIHG